MSQNCRLCNSYIVAWQPEPAEGSPSNEGRLADNWSTRKTFIWSFSRGLAVTSTKIKVMSSQEVSRLGFTHWVPGNCEITAILHISIIALMCQWHLNGNIGKLMPLCKYAISRCYGTCLPHPRMAGVDLSTLAWVKVGSQLETQASHEQLLTNCWPAQARVSWSIRLSDGPQYCDVPGSPCLS